MKRRSVNRDALLLALALDLALGEPPNALHPVAWLGTLIGAIERRAPRGLPGRELAYGAAMTLASVLAAALPALAIEALKRERKLRPILQVDRTQSRKAAKETQFHTSALVFGLRMLASAILLKPAFAGRALFGAFGAVRRPLVAGDLAGARIGLRSLVSRDPSQLDAPLIAAAAIQSLAENASDSFVAPLFYYTLFGLPGAWAYRAANTLDAMVGYRGRYEYLGKVAARLDDLLNLVPARLTALLIVLAAPLAGADARGAWWAWRRDHAQTASPNAGHPMSAIAGALDITLAKIDHYRLNSGAPAPQPADIARAERVVALALALAAGLAVAAQRRRVG
jgi:adenosylcobinamide-phosphate synthase